MRARPRIEVALKGIARIQLRRLAAILAERDISLELEPTPRSRDFDPMPRLRALPLPHFAAQGALDELVPGPRAAAILGELEHVTVVLVPGAEHTLRPWPASYWRALEDWLVATVLPGR